MSSVTLYKGEIKEENRLDGFKTKSSRGALSALNQWGNKYPEATHAVYHETYRTFTKRADGVWQMNPKNEPKTERSHTHKGNCQVCGRFQAANVKTSKMAKHGYNVEYGFFSGVCWGSDNLPYQLSRGLIAKALADAKYALGCVEEHIKERTENPRATVPIYQYIKDGATWGRGGYKWVDTEITAENFQALDPYNYKATLESVIKKFNDLYIKNRLEPHSKELHAYIHWQQKKYDEWKLCELIPIDN